MAGITILDYNIFYWKLKGDLLMKGTKLLKSQQRIELNMHGHLLHCHLLKGKFVSVTARAYLLNLLLHKNAN